MLCENTNYFTQPVNRIDKNFWHQSGRYKVHLRGTVTDIPVWDFQQDDILERFQDKFVGKRQRVFFIGRISKQWGHVIEVNNEYKRAMIKCDMNLCNGDSGGLLFYEEQDYPGRFMALGILSMIVKRKYVYDEHEMHVEVQPAAYFTSLSQCMLRS
jgi:hypothetical protein